MKPTYKGYIERQLRMDKAELRSLEANLEVFKVTNFIHQQILKERIESQEKQLEV